MAIDDDDDFGWSERSFTGKELFIFERGVFMINDAIMSFKIQRDSKRGTYSNDSWWFSLEMKAQNQVFNLYNNIQFGKKFVEGAVTDVKN